VIKRILTAVDGSDSSHRALHMAGEMAQKFDAELALLYVIRDTQIPDGVQKMADVELFHETRLTAMQMVGKQIVDECETQVRSLGADKVKSEVRPGDPAGVILHYADEADIDLIVMGSRGLGNLEGMLMGSVSRKVTNLSKVACLTIK
jgi:nucleotide-binding universal stress UspA family protein